MDDLEQQIRAWADATAPTTEAAPEAPTPIPMASGRSRSRWLAAAAIIVAVAVGAGLVVAARDDGRVRSGPEAPTASTSATTSTTLDGVPPPTGFEVLATRPAATGREGVLAAAYTPGQLARLWHDVDPGLEQYGREPVPAVDFDRQVVVSMILSTGSCSELVGFVHGSGRSFIQPMFGSSDPSCRGGPFTTQFIAAIDRSDLHTPTDLELQPDGGGDGRPQLQLRPDRPWLVTVDLEVEGRPATVAVGDEVTVRVVVNNATGRPLRTTGCGSPFSIGLRRDGRSYLPGQLACLMSFDIPTGRSVHPVTLVANRMACSAGDPTHVAPADRCLSDGTPKPLEPGEYQLVLQPPGGFTATPPPQTITLVE